TRKVDRFLRDWGCYHPSDFTRKTEVDRVFDGLHRGKAGGFLYDSKVDSGSLTLPRKRDAPAVKKVPGILTQCRSVFSEDRLAADDNERIKIRHVEAEQKLQDDLRADPVGVAHRERDRHPLSRL